jgi:hypothetical protein
MYILTIDLLLTITDKRLTCPLVREVAPHGQDSNLQTRINIWSWAQTGLDTKTNRLTDRQLQCDFDLARVESESSQNWVSPRQSWKKGSAEDLLWVGIYCDCEWLYKAWATNPIIQSKPRLIRHTQNRDSVLQDKLKMFPIISDTLSAPSKHILARTL